ncbi:ATPase domain-containing protein [Wenzhouxiangella sp. EGI_FJ10305]|uniref:ATPase domain-containing protein n=1 Tax=Wenzhouxiangella sp. EGI_FJ10305 TaxID=3243768 RepID=UPI0035E2CC5F
MELRVSRDAIRIASAIYRGSSTLISGRPGTTKRTLEASFAAAAAEREERTLYVCFDEIEAPNVRNLTSVGIDLQPHIDAGRIRFYDLSAWSALISEHFLHIQRLIEAFEPHCLIIDPVSALMRPPVPRAPGPESNGCSLSRAAGVSRQSSLLEIDLLAHPEQSVSLSVFATPALLRTGEDGQISVLYGDLSNERKLLDFLGDIESS